MPAQTLTAKLLAAHLPDGDHLPAPGDEVAVQIDQALLQDATGTLAWLEFEQMGVDSVQAAQATQYVDHNMLQTSYENPDDHRFLEGMAARYGAVFSRPGNGISHWAHMEAFDVPGHTMLGCDSHTPQAGAMAMLAIGAGGVEVAAAMAGGPYRMRMPKVVGVRLEGTFPPWVSAKDLILELLRRHGVSWGKGKVIEFHGPALEGLSVPDRGTICNMCTELGATAGVFPSDARTQDWLAAQQRGQDWRPLAADAGASYDEEETIRLDDLEPLIACPHSPGNVKAVADVAGTEATQVAIGSSVNSSFRDLEVAAHMLDDRRIAEGLSMAVSPGSRNVRMLFLERGGITRLVRAGVRELEVACGPCIGMGFAPPSEGASVRTMNRNFRGRSGTEDDQVYLASPETAAATAATGKITDPGAWADEHGVRWPTIDEPERYPADWSGYLWPPKPEARSKVDVPRGPNIRDYVPPPRLEDTIEGEVLIKLGDDVSTDDILPAGAKVLPLRSNLPALSEFTFAYVDDDFPERARRKGGGIIVGGANYGQGSSREHAAAAPAHLGVHLVIAKDFARIHGDNLVNFGVPPAVFVDPEDHERVEQGDPLKVEGLRRALEGDGTFQATSGDRTVRLRFDISPRQRELLSAGGLVRWLRHVRGG